MALRPGGAARPIMSTIESKTIRRLVQRQKELPVLSVNVQRMLASINDPEVDFTGMAEALKDCPTVAARLLGLANSAFFGHSGNVESLKDAIAILGMVTVKSLAFGMTIANAFDTKRCPAFSAERYWFSAVASATIAQQSYFRLDDPIRPSADSVYMAGLLHNLGLLLLVHLYPKELNRALGEYEAAPERRLATFIRHHLETDHYEAAGWLGRKWHLPANILVVMEHHHEEAFRGEHWVLSQLTGLCARQANDIFLGVAAPEGRDDAAWESLGLAVDEVAGLLERTRGQLAGIQEMAAILAVPGG